MRSFPCSNASVVMQKMGEKKMNECSHQKRRRKKKAKAVEMRVSQPERVLQQDSRNGEYGDDCDRVKGGEKGGGCS